MKLPSLNIQILLGAVFGVAIGLYFHGLGAEQQTVQSGLYVAGLIGTLFIDLLKMILIPLVFCSISVGIANLRQHQQMHRVWVATLLFFMGSMLIAIILGLSASLYFKPGTGLQLNMFENAMQNFEAKQLPLPEFFAQFLHGLFVNPFTALAQGNVLAVVMFALILGVALVMGGDRFKHVRTILQEALDVTMLIVGWIMRLAPLGIMALLIKLVAVQDVAMLSTLAKFVAVVMGTTLLHGIVVLPLILYLFTRRSPLWFWRGAREALVTAFATSSSAATLPITLRCTIQHLKVKPEIAGFVTPLGSTINMDGTALYEAAAALFVANLVGVELSLMQQLIVCFTAMIAAMGAPGIPSAGMVTMVLVLQSVGLPAEAIAILLPIDRLLDTLRTTVNVEGDMVGSLVVQKLVTQTSH
ncbi:MAG: dicarboxylate/amino acid:cation symporter [Methylotenera sp. 24-45-7]|jgi:Na+/H+-dicarboxylate symporter|nr:MAG: dicarboxylate/amino acid:cation symporter [Mehylophilales bacterium 35-46-6]OYZ39635.1 MAG: dicarboxylate/amino acid:cation symporter [Methylotenera sp. 24-45-7]OZA09799.1 MAG: dicarboxylate/amino acid:cation symporter [Methylotenera sp. 17-45-7]OZA54006.1 MAG: dicarboxylate/amino acid:cation symporter [Methylophilales bacterium 39-45-7]HQS37602.1 dicarboxylate/amino acid:cation symporter [Methylotenera sp.]